MDTPSAMVVRKQFHLEVEKDGSWAHYRCKVPGCHETISVARKAWEQRVRIIRAQADHLEHDHNIVPSDLLRWQEIIELESPRDEGGELARC